MRYNFDEIVDRTGTDCFKYDYRKEYFGTEDVIPMWVADMDFKTPDFILEAIRKRTEHEILGYTIRSDTFFNTIIKWYKKRQQWEIEKEWIVYTPGVVPALYLAVKAFSEEKKKVIIQPPVYHPFFSVIRSNQRRILENPLMLVDGRYYFDFEDLKNKLTPEVKVLLLCHPHNPVGRAWERKELIELAEICLKNNIIILSDEIHSDLVLPGFKHEPVASLSEEIANITVTCIAPSKTFNLAGLSTAVVVISNPELRKRFSFEVENSHLWIGNIFGKIALESAYSEGEDWLTQLLDYIRGNFNMLTDYLNTHIPDIKLIQPEATYLAWLDMRNLGLGKKELSEFMIKKARIGCNDGQTFGSGGEGFQRMNIACPKQILIQALDQLKDAVHQL